MFLRAPLDNPVLRHTGRLTSPTRLAWIVAGILLLVAVATGLLQQYWTQYSVYADRPRLYVRWFYLFVLAEVFIVLPWSAVRGAAVWRRLESDGHLEEYRRTRLPALSIVTGALWGSLKPVLPLLAVSSALGLAAALLAPGGGQGPDVPTPLQTLGAHALLGVMACCCAALGQLFTSWTRAPAMALPLCFLLLAAAITAIAFLNPYYPAMRDPDRWIWATLLPNPAVAVGTLLKIDLLRTGWIYDHVRAQDYFSIGFSYPSPIFTAALYGGVGAGAALLTAARLTRRSG
jgi:hypothetical protein